MMELWLIRHGKAELGIGIPDGQRRLVDEGREKSEELAIYLKENLWNKTVEFWSSPLVRARQTVEILAASFKEIPHFKGEIANGDFYTLLTQWEHNKAEVQIVVGHEPLLSDWVYEFTRKEVAFETTELVKLDIKHWIPPEGKVIESIRVKNNSGGKKWKEK